MGSSHFVNSCGSLWGIERDLETNRTDKEPGPIRLVVASGKLHSRSDRPTYPFGYAPRFTKLFQLFRLATTFLAALRRFGTRARACPQRTNEGSRRRSAALNGAARPARDDPYRSQNISE